MHDCYILYELCPRAPQQSVEKYAERRVNLSNRYSTSKGKVAVDPSWGSLSVRCTTQETLFCLGGALNKAEQTAELHTSFSSSM